MKRKEALKRTEYEAKEQMKRRGEIVQCRLKASLLSVARQDKKGKKNTKHTRNHHNVCKIQDARHRQSS